MLISGIYEMSSNSLKSCSNLGILNSIYVYYVDFIFRTSSIIVKWYNLKEMKCTKSVVDFVVDVMRTQWENTEIIF